MFFLGGGGKTDSSCERPLNTARLPSSLQKVIEKMRFCCIIFFVKLHKDIINYLPESSTLVSFWGLLLIVDESPYNFSVFYEAS